MMDEQRSILRRTQRMVVKVGSSLLTQGGKAVDVGFIARLASGIAQARAEGREILLVTSGAVAAGVAALGIPRPTDIATKQAVAAIGQSRLMHTYELLFDVLGLRIAQVLLTHEDLGHRRRYINARTTLMKLLELGVIPILNENDTVAFDEIRVGDNDTLSAEIATLVGADLLLILTDTGGLYTANPRTEPDAQLIPVVDRVDADLEKAAGGAGSAAGTGGMATKLEAAKRANAAGTAMVIADGKTDGVIARVLAGESIGTLFLPASDRLASRKHWILFTLRSAGQLRLDEGATEAVKTNGKSLLPKGITAVEGKFERGDAISLCDPTGAEFARGLVAYGADEVRRISGKRSDEIEGLLGYRFGDEVVHRDDLVLMA